jgi:hypothetical protein
MYYSYYIVPSSLAKCPLCSQTPSPFCAIIYRIYGPGSERLSECGRRTLDFGVSGIVDEMQGGAGIKGVLAPAYLQ